MDWNDSDQETQQYSQYIGPNKQQQTTQVQTQDNLQALAKTRKLSPILEQIINAYTNAQDEKKIIQIILSYFPPKQSSSAQCTTYFDTPCIYYKCYDCQKHNDACLCQQCFVRGNHEKHRFQVRKTHGNSCGSCDCGNEDVWKKQGFCPEHSGHMAQIQIQKQQEQTFKRVFGALFCLHYQKHLKYREKLKKMLFNTLIKLNDQSPTYNYLTRKVLAQHNKSTNKSYLTLILSDFVKQFSTLENKLFIKMIAESEFKLELTKNFIICMNTIPNFEDTKCYQYLSFQLMANTEIINQLAQQGVLFYPPQKQLRTYEYYRRLKFLLANDLIPEKLVKGLLLQNFIQENEDIVDFISSVVISLKDNEQIQFLMQQKLIQHVIKNSQKIKNISQLAQMTWLYFIYISKGNIQTLLNKNLYKQLFPAKKIIIDYLKAIFIPQILNTNSQTFACIGLLFIAQLLQEKQRQQLFQSIWEEFFILLRKQKPLEDNKLSICNEMGVRMELMLYSISKLNQHIHFYMHNYFECDDIANYLAKQLIEQQLYSKAPQLSKQQFLIILQSLKVSNQNYLFAKTLVKQLPNNRFQYIGKDLGIGVKHRVQLNIKTDNIRTKNYLALTPAMEYLGSILTPKIITKYLQVLQFIPQQFKKTNELEARSQIAFTYCLLVFMDNFYHGSNPLIRQQVQNAQKLLTDIKHNLSTMQKQQQQFYIVIGKMFGFDNFLDEFEAKNKPTQLSKLEQRKKFIEELKRKKFEEIKSKQQKIQIQEKIKEEQQIDQNSQICLYCREPAKQNNQLYYFACISEASGLNKIYKQKQLDYQLKLCKHFVHKNCFFDNFGQDIYSQCPLCKSSVNCILPFIKQKNKSYWEDTEWINRIEFILELVQQKDMNLYSTSALCNFINFLVYKRSFLALMGQKIDTPQLKENADHQIFHLIKNYLQHQNQQQIQKASQCFKQLKTAYIQLDNFAGKLKLMTLQLLEMDLYDEKPAYSDALMKFQKILNEEFAAIVLSNFYSLENPQKIIENIPLAVRLKVLQTNIQIVQFPKNAQEFIEKRQLKCHSCRSIKSDIWKCLLCNQSKCQSCDGRQYHCRIVHGSSGLFLLPSQAQLYLTIGMKTYKSDLYKNELEQYWEPKNIKQNPKQFLICSNNIEKSYQFLFAYWFNRS